MAVTVTQLVSEADRVDQSGIKGVMRLRPAVLVIRDSLPVFARSVGETGEFKDKAFVANGPYSDEGQWVDVAELDFPSKEKKAAS